MNGRERRQGLSHLGDVRRDVECIRRLLRADDTPALSAWSGVEHDSPNACIAHVHGPEDTLLGRSGVRIVDVLVPVGGVHALPLGVHRTSERGGPTGRASAVAADRSAVRAWQGDIGDERRREQGRGRRLATVGAKVVKR
jgi:hypothetical protein